MDQLEFDIPNPKREDRLAAEIMALKAELARWEKRVRALEDRLRQIREISR